MELSVDPNKKKELTKTVIQSTKRLYSIKIISRISVLLGLISGILFCLTNFLISDLGTVNIRGVMTKDIAHIISTSVLIIIIGIFIGVALHYLLKNLSGKNIDERVEESCIFSENSLIYSFRVKYHSTPSSKVVITVPFKDVTTIDYDSTLHKVTIKGNVIYTYFENYAKGIKSNNRDFNVNKWIIYDYFTPSLCEALRSYEIRK